MDRHIPSHPGERLPQHHHHHASSTSSYPPPYHMPTAQPPTQIPFADPFSHGRDPFIPGPHSRKGSMGMGPASLGWPPAQGNNSAGATQPSPSQHHPPLPHPSAPPPPHANGLATMSLPYDPSRRHSLGGAAGSPSQYPPGPLDPPPAPPSFASRNMPPPSPPQPANASSSSSILGPAPRGPPTASPFSGIRDLASLSTSSAPHRSSGGMSISSILGGGEETRRPAGSPHGSGGYPSTALPPMQPPSPGRARSSSMREGYSGTGRELSPGRVGPLGEPRPASAALGLDRYSSDARREETFRASQPPRESAHSFRAFKAPPEQSPNMNGPIGLGRPSSQPVEPGPTRSLDDFSRRDEPSGGRLGVFRAFGDGPYKPKGDSVVRHDPAPYPNGAGPTSQPSDRAPYGSPMMQRNIRDQPPAPYQQQVFYGPPTRDELPGMFRPSYPPPQTVLEQARESIENRQHQDLRREHHPSSPPTSDIQLDRYRNGFHERPLTYEEHQRMEAHHLNRKGSDGSVHRAILNISPELNRKGRNSPLPQAVQGAQPRHVGGGDNPGIKSEFGRMFSGLGSGVGSATPTPGQHANGTTTPSRLTPSRNPEGGDANRAIGTEADEGRGGSKTGRGGKKNRRAREETDRGEAEIYDGRMTPSLSQRGNKRAKTAHHHHHHAHHHHHHHQQQHENADPQPNPFNTIRFSSNPLSHSSLITHPTHHHHHHHGAHAHQAHHHHHPPRPMPALRKPTVTINTQHLLDQIADKPRNHLGSHLYEADVSFSSSSVSSDPRVSYVSTMKPMPRLDGQENSTYMVRIPRWYLSRSKEEIEAGESNRLEEICKRRQVFGTEVYSDDSDVVAAAIHSGWLKGDFGEWNEDLNDICDDGNEPQDKGAQKHVEESPLSLPSKPAKPVIPPSNYDAHITILILPPLDSYASTSQNHILSREWNKDTPHDGMSFMIHRVDFVAEGVAGRSFPRGAKARKARLAMEENKRQEAAKALLMLPGFGGIGGGGGDTAGKVVGVGAS